MRKADIDAMVADGVVCGPAAQALALAPVVARTQQLIVSDPLLSATRVTALRGNRHQRPAHERDTMSAPSPIFCGFPLCRFPVRSCRLYGHLHVIHRC